MADLDRAAGLFIGNTWAWPAPDGTRPFSEIVGGLRGGLTSQRLNLFLRVMIPMGIRRRSLTKAEMTMYARPFPTVESRPPVRIFPREILAAGPFRQQIETGLPLPSDLPALLLWADRDMAFKDAERRRWQRVLSNRTDHSLRAASHYWQDDAGEEAVEVIRQSWGGRP